MGKRCQVCDGPVVNGRCKYCGMPYRNDAVMYHLNEDRSEHYRHASEKVRKEQRKVLQKGKILPEAWCQIQQRSQFHLQDSPGQLQGHRPYVPIQEKYRLQRRNLRSLRKRAEYPRSSGWYLQAQLLYIPLYRIPWMWTV